MTNKHKWITKIYGNPFKCEQCGIIGKKNKGKKWSIQRANISGNYIRDIKDYKGLCVKCHAKFDNITKTINDYKHGTLSKYRKGCKCKLCRESKRKSRNKFIS